MNENLEKYYEILGVKEWMSRCGLENHNKKDIGLSVVIGNQLLSDSICYKWILKVGRLYCDMNMLSFKQMISNELNTSDISDLNEKIVSNRKFQECRLLIWFADERIKTLPPIDILKCSKSLSEKEQISDVPILEEGENIELYRNRISQWIKLWCGVFLKRYAIGIEYYSNVLGA